MATNKRLIKSNDEGGSGAASFNTVLYTGNGTSQTITGVGFDPDMVWVKRRDASANSHILQDTIRGGGQANTLIPDRTDAQGVNGQYGYISSFGSDSFGVAAGTTSAEHTNFLNASYVAWCWKAGGAAVTNTDGTITSQVSANTEAGFSIVSYTGNGTQPSTIGHGLDSAPKIVINKCRSLSGTNWHVYSSALGATSALVLNDTAAAYTGVGEWGSNPDSSVLYVNNTNTNNSGRTYVSYCFAEVAGFSKFGSYVGNGNVNGPIITTVFEPAFVMTKSTDTNSGWIIWDNKRNPTNERTKALFPHSSLNEVDGTYKIDINTNGFQITTTDSNQNVLNENYIYMAFANQF